MNYSIRATIRGRVAPDHRLSWGTRLWRQAIDELGRRSAGKRESGAFILGTRDGNRCRAIRLAYYDDLDPHSLDGGIVEFDGAGCAQLWQMCRETGLVVVADVHTHGRIARQSPTDQANPMVATAGHIALVVPDLAQRPVQPHEVGIYEYEGQHRWKAFLGPGAARFLYVGWWG